MSPTLPTCLMDSFRSNFTFAMMILSGTGDPPVVFLKKTRAGRPCHKLARTEYRRRGRFVLRRRAAPAPVWRRRRRWPVAADAPGRAVAAAGAARRFHRSALARRRLLLPDLPRGL